MQLPATRAEAIAEFAANEATMEVDKPDFIPAITLERFVMLARLFNADHCAGLTLGSSGCTGSYVSESDGLCVAFFRCMKAAAVTAPACFLDPRLGAIKAISDIAFSMQSNSHIHLAAVDVIYELAACIFKRQDSELKSQLLEDLRANGISNFCYSIGAASADIVRRGSLRPDDLARIPLYNFLRADVSVCASPVEFLNFL